MALTCARCGLIGTHVYECKGDKLMSRLPIAHGATGFATSHFAKWPKTECIEPEKDEEKPTRELSTLDMMFWPWLWLSYATR